MDIVLERGEQCLANDIVLVDGFSSSGKSLLGPIFGYLERGEQWQVPDFHEQLAVLYYIGDISYESLCALVECNSDKLLYNLFIGRNVNFRSSDLSSPFYDGTQEKYLQRIEGRDGDCVSKDIQSSKPILPLNVHFIYGYSDVLLKAFGHRLKLYSIMLRNPLYLIYRWYEGEWVDRICANNREFNLCIKLENKLVPWYVKEYVSEYVEANAVEKCILTVYNLYKRIFSMHEDSGLSDKQKVLFVFYEEFIQYPNAYIDKICVMLNTERVDSFSNLMKKLSLPRSFEQTDITFLNFFETHSEAISPVYKEKIAELEMLYSEFYAANKIT